VSCSVMSDHPARNAPAARTSGASRPLWTTRAETAADVPAVRGIHLAAFPTAQEADLVDALRADASAWIDGLSVVAAEGEGAPVAHALLTRCHIGETPALCLAPVAVRPERQGLGAGTAVVRAVLRAAEDVAERFVVVLGHPAYYPRFGFTRASAHGIRLSVEVPDEALMALTLGPGRLPAGTVRYAEAFGI
jgi:putative acetyltransferase